MFFSLKDSFLKTTTIMILNYLPVVAVSKAGSSYRVFVFIDGSNFYHSLVKSFGSAKLNLEHFTQTLNAKGTIEKIFYYTATLNMSENSNAYSAQQRFLSKISQIKNLSVFLGRLEKRGNTKVEKGVDFKLAVDLITNAFNDKYDIAIIVSNDSDFVPAIEEVQNLGKKVWNVTFPKTQSYHLNQICDKTIEINSIKQFQNGENTL
jgi:uncharacterized LabA/DUF88 family protein